MQHKLVLTIVGGACILWNGAGAAKLPKGVILPPGVVVPDDFELPPGITIPEGFEITQEMVDQYMKYIARQKRGEGDDDEDELWFKQLALNHPNSDLQMNVIKMDTAAANEESEFQAKLENTFKSKEVILPTVAVVITIIAIWAFMTKCGKRSCCKKERPPTKAQATRKSVKSDRSETNNDIEGGSHFSGGKNSEDVDSAGNSNTKMGTTMKTFDLEMTETVQVGRSSAPSKASAISALAAQ